MRACAPGSEQSAEQLDHGPVAVLHAVMDSVVDNYILVDDEIARGPRAHRAAGLRGTRGVDANGDLPAQARGAGVPAGVPAAGRRAGAAVRAAAPRDRRPRRQRGHAVLPRHLRPPAASQRPRRVLRPAALPTSCSAHLAQISVQQNDDMRKISAWVAIAAVPTMIAGIYGMNFDYMPELTASVRRRRRRVLLRVLRRAALMASVVLRALSRVQAVRLALAGQACRRRRHVRQVAAQPARASATTRTSPRITRYQTKRHQGVGRDEPQQPGDRRVGHDEGDDDARRPSGPTPRHDSVASSTAS